MLSFYIFFFFFSSSLPLLLLLPSHHSTLTHCSNFSHQLIGTRPSPGYVLALRLPFPAGLLIGGLFAYLEV